MTTEDIAWLVKYFSSAGSVMDGRPKSLLWLPWASGKQLRYYWRRCQDEVFHEVSDEAYALMDAEFRTGAPGRNFDAWPTAERRQIYALCADSGCEWWVDEHGNVLPIGWTMENYREKAREHLARVNADAGEDSDG